MFKYMLKTFNLLAVNSSSHFGMAIQWSHSIQMIRGLASFQGLLGSKQRRFPRNFSSDSVREP